MGKAEDAQKLADRMALESRIAAVRDNIRTLTEQAAGYSGAGTEEFISKRIADQEAVLTKLQADLAAL